MNDLANEERETLKRCSQCGEYKPLSEFYRKHTSSDGRFSSCKVCRKLYDDRHYDEVQSKILAHKKEYYVKQKDRIAKSRRTQQALERHRRQMIKYRSGNPDKVKAHNAVNRAVATGKLSAPEANLCAHCGGDATEYHHHSYEREHWLDVMALCHSCHMMIHVGIHNE